VAFNAPRVSHEDGKSQVQMTQIAGTNLLIDLYEKNLTCAANEAVNVLIIICRPFNK